MVFAALSRCCAFSIANCAIASPVSGCWFSQSAKWSLMSAADERGALARRKPFLGLPRELRLLDLHGQHEVDAFPDVLGRELDAARQEVAELAELAQRVREPRAHAVHVRAALRRRDQVHVALEHGLAAPVAAPGDGPFDGLALALELARERLLGDEVAAAEGLPEILLEAARVDPAFRFLRLLDLERDLEARAQHGLRAQQVLQARQRELRRVEVLRIRPEAHRRARRRLRDLADDLELAAALAVGKAHVVFLAVAADPDLEVLRQRVDDGHSDAVQAARELVVLVRELTAGVQPREDQLDAGELLLRMDVDGHAAAVVGDFERAVGVEHDVDLLRMPSDSLVDAVVDDLVREVVRPRRIRVHARDGGARARARSRPQCRQRDNC